MFNIPVEDADGRQGAHITICPRANIQSSLTVNTGYDHACTFDLVTAKPELAICGELETCPASKWRVYNSVSR